MAGMHILANIFSYSLSTCNIENLIICPYIITKIDERIRIFVFFFKDLSLYYQDLPD